MLLFLSLDTAKIRVVAALLKCGIEHVLANLMYGPMLYEWNVLEIYLSQEACIICFEV